MLWRVAKSLLTLRDQINILAPNRSKASDGTIGDANHATRDSDHNPWVKDGAEGVVPALDITNDPAHGIVSEEIAEALRVARDPRLKYVISNRKIANMSIQGGAWRPYYGASPHDHHCHISVLPDKHLYDMTSPWELRIHPIPKPNVEPIAVELAKVEGIRLALNAHNATVITLQTMLNKNGAKLKIDGNFGPVTEAAVIAFQKAHSLVSDGVVGVYTWIALFGGSKGEQDATS